MEVVETGTCAQEGIGKPDFSKEISLGRTRPGLTLKANETLKAFGLSLTAELSPMPHVKAPLAPGGTSHLVDSETGLDMPYLCPAGYTFILTTMGHSMSQDFMVKVYIDTFFVCHLGTKAGGVMDYLAEVKAVSTSLYDPTAALPHLVDGVVVNNGGDDMEGTLSAFAIIAAVGTEPLPVIKTVRCKHCGYEEVVPLETTRWICPACGGLTIYGDLSKWRGD